jgi:hypothetical protein
MKLTASTPQSVVPDDAGDEFNLEYEAALAWVAGKIAARPTAMLNARAKRQ